MILAGSKAAIANCDCRFALIAQKADALISDPPYGIGYKVNKRDWSGALEKGTGRTYGQAKEPIAGDTEPFDPVPLLNYTKIALFGANNYSSRLPEGSWVVWDKRRDSKQDDHADAELVWINTPGVIRIHRQKWRGVVREGEENASNSKKLHPNQKPVALLTYLIERLKVLPGETIIDPYMGSGSTGVAALRAGCKFIGFEIDPSYYEIAERRLLEEFGV